MFRNDFGFRATKAVVPVAMLCVLSLHRQNNAQEFDLIGQQPAKITQNEAAPNPAKLDEAAEVNRAVEEPVAALAQENFPDSGIPAGSDNTIVITNGYAFHSNGQTVYTAMQDNGFSPSQLGQACSGPGSYPAQDYSTVSRYHSTPACHPQPIYSSPAPTYAAPIYSSPLRSRFNSISSPRSSQSGLAQSKAVQAAQMGLRGHLGGGLGGAKYEGVGWSNQSPQDAIENCCYWGTRPTSQIGVSKGQDGCWYACVLYH